MASASSPINIGNDQNEINIGNDQNEINFEIVIVTTPITLANKCVCKSDGIVDVNIEKVWIQIKSIT